MSESEVPAGEHHHLHMSSNAYNAFLAEMDKPAEAIPELTGLFTRHSKLPEA